MQVLAARFARRDAALLDALRVALMQDPKLERPTTLAHHEFLDHLPEVLEAFVSRLLYSSGIGSRPMTRHEWIAGQRHGYERWLQGYSLNEVISEWRHLALSLTQEMEAHAHENPDISRDAIIAASIQIEELIVDGIQASAEQYVRMQRAGTASMAAELQASLEQVHKLECERANTWRRAVHDLRGSVGAISYAAEMLKQHDAAATRLEFSEEVLTRGLASLREMLDELAILARLDATMEKVQISSFDVSDLLRRLAATIRPSAAMRGLVLELEGPEVLAVEGDALKVQRIAQNLLVNAVKYTEQGGVWMSWRADAGAPGARWILTVRDSGPGLDARLASCVVEALLDNPAGHARNDYGVAVAVAQAGSDVIRKSGDGDSIEHPGGSAGEGIGLSIVKVLCRLLSVGVELENEPGRGLTFRLTFPCHYAKAR